jgi:urea transport system ATP-binding protein
MNNLHPSADLKPHQITPTGLDFLAPDKNHTVNVDHSILLYVESLSVAFEGFQAINDLNLYITDGELRCIIGPNGAGKTTMMDIITGKTAPDSGIVYFGQTIDLLKLDEPAIAQAGVGRKFQKPTVFEHLSVWHNLELAMAQKHNFWSLLHAKMTPEQRANIDEVLVLIGLKDQARKLAGTLSHGQKQWLEIGALLMQRPRLLLVDEPVAGMTHQEMDKTAELLRSLAGKHSVIVVEHDMEFVRNLSDGGKTVSVLHQGSILAEGTMAEVQNDDRVKQVYLGE